MFGTIQISDEALRSVRCGFGNLLLGLSWLISRFLYYKCRVLGRSNTQHELTYLYSYGAGRNSFPALLFSSREGLLLWGPGIEGLLTLRTRCWTSTFPGSSRPFSPSLTDRAPALFLPITVPEYTLIDIRLRALERGVYEYTLISVFVSAPKARGRRPADQYREDSTPFPVTL